MSKTTEEILERLKREPIARTYTVERDSIDKDARTVRVAIASDKAVDHWFGQLELSMDKGAIRTNRIKEIGIPLLMGHDHTRQVGIIDRIEVGNDGVLRGDARFDTHQLAQDAFNSVDNGILRGVSVGALIHKMDLKSAGKSNGPDVYRSDDWEPYEASLTAIPADISVGVNRSAEFQPLNFQPEKRAISTNTENTMTPEEIAAAEAAKAQRTAAPAVVETVRSPELVVADEIREWGTQLGEPTLAASYIRSAMNADGKFTGTKEGFFASVRAAQPATIVPPPMDPQAAADRQGAPRVELARTIPRYGKLNAFRGAGNAERAYRFGQFLMASVLGNTKAREFCSQNGIAVTRAMGESVNELGGYLVPDEFGNDLIDLREQYGVFRRNAKIVPMASDTRSDPRRTGGLTAYFVAEAGAITASDMGWDRVELVAKKLAVLARYSSEVNEDSVINFGDTLAGEIAYAFAEKEDRCGFLGDASSTYGGITGVTQKLLGLSATRANIAGLVVGSGNLFSELAIGDFEAVVAKLPQYADTDAAAWYVHRGFYWNVMVKAMLASGGVTAAEIEDARKQRFMGYRVEFTQVMPNVDANDQVVALFGDLAKAASMGIRRDTQIALSEHSRFANDQIEIRGTERFDVNVHDVGNQSGTAADRVPGPIVGLLSAAS